ncbi:MAG: hypothetical protein Q8K72_20510, partial [Acidimicrobiales bacterium]|nr:hypothetical protein [Acidimicrobiales bacterium]
MVIGWLIGAVLLGVVAGAIGGKSRQDFTIAEFESTRGIDILEEHFGGFGGGIPGSIAFEADAGVEDPAVVAEVQRLFTS